MQLVHSFIILNNIIFFKHVIVILVFVYVIGHVHKNIIVSQDSSLNTSP